MTTSGSRSEMTVTSIFKDIENNVNLYLHSINYYLFSKLLKLKIYMILNINVAMEHF